jgi:hypothetical membrane protein
MKRTGHAVVPTSLSLAPLLIAGIAGPLWFTTLVIVQGLLQPDYSHIAMPISALAAWPYGWIQILNFLVMGAMMAAYAIGVHYVIRPTRFGLVGIILLLASCLGLVLAGVFPWINVNGVPTETPQHVVGAVLSFSGARLGLIFLSRRMAADPEWQSLSSYILATGIVMLVLFIALGGFAIDAGTPLHPWAGLLQRVMLALWFPCIIVVAVRALRIVRERQLQPNAIPS